MRRFVIALVTILLICQLCFMGYDFFHGLWRDFSYGLFELTRGEMLVHAYADEHGLRFSDYPEELIALLDRNPETSAFVLEYPMKKDTRQDCNLSEYEGLDSVPLLMQWDQRWGYIQYGNGPAGLTACGPLCLSMVGFYLTEDPIFAPDKVMGFAQRNGYCIPGNGTSWTLISEGGEELGLKVTELPLHENTMISYLEAGLPIICIMGPGDFTSTGHYIVLTGYENGAFRVNDPNSYENSRKEWTYDRISDQIRNLWAIEGRTAED